MKVAGFTFIRNAVKNDYPIVEAITSILSICDEFIIAVGACDDGTLTLIKNINSDKIKILETVWDDSIREGGRVFAEETNKAFKAISPDVDWCFYIQGDECLHEKYLDTVKKAMHDYHNNPQVEGLLFKYKHFYGSYDYFAHSRRWYRHEIRVVRNLPDISSYRDAQGFRKSGKKLKVKAINAEIYHYGWVKPPKGLTKRLFNSWMFYTDKADDVVNKNLEEFDDYNYDNAENLIAFEGTHPKVIIERIKHLNWKFNFDPSKIKYKMKFKHRIMMWVEKLTGFRLFEYKNFKKI
jgi:hypothetical protein